MFIYHYPLFAFSDLLFAKIQSIVALGLLNGGVHGDANLTIFNNTDSAYMQHKFKQASDQHGYNTSHNSNFVSPERTAQFIMLFITLPLTNGMVRQYKLKL